MIRSLRSRLLLAMIGGIALMLAVFGAVIYASIRTTLVAEADASLQVAAQGVASGVQNEHGRLQWNERSQRLPESDQAGSAIYYQFWLDDKPTSLQAAAMKHEQLPQFHGEPAEPEFRFLTLEDGTPLRAVGIAFPVAAAGQREAESEGRERDNEYGYESESENAEHDWERQYKQARDEARRNGADERALRDVKRKWELEKKKLEEDKEAREYEKERRGRNVAPAKPPADRVEYTGELTIVLARDCSALLAQLSSLRWLLVGSGAGTLAAGVLISILVLGRGLSPLRRLGSEIAAFQENDLTARFSAGAMPSEIAPVVERLNDLLGRLAAAFQRERAFAADVAHELRTPVAGLRTTIEVALASEGSIAEYREALCDALEITLQMQSLVQNLLMLARIEAGHVQVHPEPVPLAALVDECWRPHRGTAFDRKLRFENRLPAELTCRSDRNLLGIVFANLLQNAAKYANDGGQVWIEGRWHKGRVAVSVCNSGCGLKKDQLPQVFERFWRGDANRRETGLHAGLGLALVRRIVTLLDGRVAATLDNGTFSIHLAWKQAAAAMLPSSEIPAAHTLGGHRQPAALES
jgi:signal transduction histidine kinase